MIGDNTSADRFASRAEVTSLASFTYCALPCRIQLERVHVKSRALPRHQDVHAQLPSRRLLRQPTHSPLPVAQLHAHVIT